MKIIFWGSDDFAQYHLKRLHISAHKIVACVTKPDRSKGRHLKVVPTPIKDFALENKIALLQPETLQDPKLIAQLRSLNADLFVVIAYGKILPLEVLKIPARYAVNVHASLLPKYRGAAPINWAIINGERATGITIIRLNEAMDGGDIIAQKKHEISSTDTAVTLREKLMEEGSTCLLQTLEAIEKNKISFLSQDRSAVTIAPKLTKELGEIDWNKKAEEIHNLVRGLLPWPGAYTYVHGKMLKILGSEFLPKKDGDPKPGVVSGIDEKGLHIATSKGELVVKRVNLESGRPMDVHSFLRGHQIKLGEALGKK